MEKLTCAFWIWGIFGGIYGDFDKSISQLKERGFNCIRLEDGAGLMCRPDGTPRGDVTIYEPFGKYGENNRQFIVKDGVINIRKRLLELFSAAERHDVYIVLSSWYYLHTNWFYGSDVNDELLSLTVDEKFEYFSEELSRILDFLRENRLIHRVAFAEIFNEFDGHDFAWDITPEEQKHLKEIHEKAIDKLKKRHPDVLIACDTATAYPNENILPLNADVFNFHSYYAWKIYNIFEGEFMAEGTVSEQTAEFLTRLTTDEELTKSFRGRNISVDDGWRRRIRLYSSINPQKLPGLQQLIAEDFEKNYDRYIQKMENGLKNVLDIRNRIMPDAELFMGEGVSYCTHNFLNFEEFSEKYCNMLLYQASLHRDNGLWGTVVRTTSGPEDVSWEIFKDLYKKANEIFQG